MQYEINISKHPKKGFTLEFKFKRKPKEDIILRRLLAWAKKLLRPY